MADITTRKLSELTQADEAANLDQVPISDVSDTTVDGPITKYVTIAQIVDGLATSASVTANTTLINEHKADFDNPHQVNATDVGLGAVDNTADADKPVSTAVTAALGLKADNTALSALETTVDGKQNQITGDAEEITIPGAASDGSDLVFAAGTASTIQLITSVQALQTSFASGAGTVQFLVTGLPNINITISTANVSPSGWVADSSITTGTTTALDSLGQATVLVAIPVHTTLGADRSFQIGVTPTDEYQAPVLSEVVTQYSDEFLITGVSVVNTMHGNAGSVETITVTGLANEGYTLSLVEVSPLGWITSGAFSGTTGTIGMDGSDSTNTITIPDPNDDTVNRSFRIRVTANDDNTQTVDSVTITQMHTQSTAAGNLAASVTSLLTGANLDTQVTVSQGDAPFTAVINQNATDATDNPLQTITFSDLNVSQTIPTVDLSSFALGDYTFYTHVSDNDGDIVIDMETVTLSNNAPTGSSAITTGSATPSAGSQTIITASYTDSDGDPLTYQWQFYGEDDAPYNNAGPFETKGDWDRSASGDFSGGFGGRVTTSAAFSGTSYAFDLSLPSSGEFYVAFWTSSDRSGTPDTIRTVTASADSRSSTGFGVSDDFLSSTFDIVDGLTPYSGDNYDFPKDRYEIQSVSEVSFTNLVGETNATLTVPLGDIDTASAVDKSTVATHTGAGATSTNNICNLWQGGPLFEWGTTANNTVSVIAIYADGANHATANPLYALGDPSGASAAGGWSGGGRGTATPDGTGAEVFANLNDNIAGMVDAAVEWVPNANVEIWEGVTVLPATPIGGIYRVIVSDGTTTTTSDGITITPS